MLETLLTILAWDIPAPEIFLEGDGDIGLEWPPQEVWVSINRGGGVNWVSPKSHGTDINELQELLNQLCQS